MSTTGRIEAQEKRHAELDDLIDQEMKAVSPDTLSITAMKKEKLLIKEELARLGAAETA